MISVGIDLGNSKISCIVCDIKSDGKVKLLSFISKPTNSLKKSYVTNLSNATNEVESILNQAAHESQTEIASVRLNIPVIDSLSFYSDSKIIITNEKISDLDIKKTINLSDLLEPVDNYNIIYRSITNYELDKKTFVDDPIGMYSNNLKVNFFKLAIKENFIKTFIAIFKKLNIHIENLVPNPLSSALSTLNQDEKDLGSICIDLGAESTSFSIFENKKLIFVDGIPIGGKNITTDLARGVSTTIESAERLKTLYGSVITSPSDEHEIIEVPSLGAENNQFNQINRSLVNSIIKPRVEETLELIWQKLKDYNFHKKTIRNLVLTGGGSMLEGIEEYAQIIFDSKTRLAHPKPLEGLPSKFLKPQFSQTIGLMLFEPKNHEIDFLAKKSEKIEKNTVFGRFSSWLDQYI